MESVLISSSTGHATRSARRLALVTACLLLGQLSLWAQGGTFVVDTVADTSGTAPATSALDSDGNISLRSAIEAADNQPGAIRSHLLLPLPQAAAFPRSVSRKNFR